MDLNKMTKEELEILSHTDLAYYILKNSKKTMNTPTIFKTICGLLGYSDEEYASKIGDFYTSLTTDKRFILLDNAEWDLRDNHSVKIVVDDEDEEEELDEEIEEETEEEPEENIEENIDSDIDDDDLVDDDMDDLEIIDEDEELEEN